ncbi:conserved hypothetical protein [Trichinella spiralis]|uniref:hypothetical protein n=1 Tax=Trichinella spiralis TaxID=6334 RepID=UPI0001EFBBA8|nr:conserved hypothetical protein [Trichinella spiralis]
MVFVTVKLQNVQITRRKTACGFEWLKVLSAECHRHSSPSNYHKVALLTCKYIQLQMIRKYICDIPLQGCHKIANKTMRKSTTVKPWLCSIASNNFLARISLLLYFGKSIKLKQV